MSPPVSASQFVSLLPAPPDVSAAWNTFSLQRIDAPRHLETTFADHVVTLHISGTHHLRQVLAHHIICSYSSLSGHRSPTRGGLTGPRLKIALDYIHDSLGQRISLHALAASVGISARHFERAFREAVGVPPHAYVTEQRLAAARHLLLAQPRLTIEGIARRVGFSSSSHLATAFRRQAGVSPRAFRALHSR